MQYELWHIGTANLMDDFKDEAEALDAARAYLTPDDDGQVVDVALMVYDDSGQRIRSIEGSELSAMVSRTPPGDVRQSA